MSVYDEGEKRIDLGDLRDEPCWLGVDLSNTIDLTVIVACWRTADGYAVFPWFFCPRDRLLKGDDSSGELYVKWANPPDREFDETEDYIEATEGSVVDFQAVEDRIVDLAERFNVREIAFDPFMARQVQPKIVEMGLPVTDFRQVPSLMMSAYHELEHAILGGELQHGGHPVLRHCFENVVVQRNPQGHVSKFTKAKRYLSIDGAVATAMAVARCAEGDGTGSYDGDDWAPQDSYV